MFSCLDPTCSFPIFYEKYIQNEVLNKILKQKKKQQKPLWKMGIECIGINIDSSINMNFRRQSIEKAELT